VIFDKLKKVRIILIEIKGIIKKRIKNKSIVFLISFLIIAFVSLYFYDNINKKYINSYLKKNNAFFENSNEFMINKIIENKEKNSKTAFASKNSEVLKIEIIKDLDADEAEKYVRDRKFLINSIFEPVASPYPEAITNIIDCPDKFKPEIKKIKIDNFETAYYNIFATDRLTYGACSDDLIAYQTILTWVYCKKNENLFQIELFIPKKRI